MQNYLLKTKNIRCILMEWANMSKIYKTYWNHSYTQTRSEWPLVFINVDPLALPHLPCLFFIIVVSRWKTPTTFSWFPLSNFDKVIFQLFAFRLIIHIILIVILTLRWKKLCTSHWKKTMVVTTNSHCKNVIISGTIFYSRDYYNHIVKSTIIILYYIFLFDIAIKNIFPLREI